MKRMHWRTWFAACACAGACASGCGPRPEPMEQEEAAPIVGGEPDTGDPSVVALYGRGVDGDFMCTGSIIAPTVVLTAAHCVSPTETGPRAQFVVLAGASINHRSSGADGQTWGVREVHPNPRWSSQDLAAGHDQGIVILDRPTPLRPLPLLRHALAESEVGKEVRLVGYGLSSGRTQTGAGIKRQAVTTLRGLSADLLEIGTGLRGTCNGDSGGPAFMDVGGEETIVGTTSFGKSDCAGPGYDARVDTDLAFIERYLPACAAACVGRSCGDDGCGGSCGSCGGAQACSSAGRCEAPGGCGGEREPNDSALQANPLCADGTVHGSLSTTGDQDWFSFAVPAASSYEVTVSGGPSGAALRVYKRSASGLTFIGDGPVVSRHTDAGGTYLARVMGSGAPALVYTLAVRLTQ